MFQRELSLIHTEIESAKEEISQIGHEICRKIHPTPVSEAQNLHREQMIIFANLKEKKCANASKCYCFFNCFPPAFCKKNTGMKQVDPL